MLGKFEGNSVRKRNTRLSFDV